MAKLKNVFFISVTSCIGLFTGLMNTASAESSRGLVSPVYHASGESINPDAVVRAERLNRAANMSYRVRGVRYTPRTSVSEFKQTGRASWYGPNFHNKLTSSGERYDMNMMTAAHKTLPIPSYVRVTNLSNGKSVIVRINDRGPFHGNRIIDVSQAAARRLGFINRGTANVRVEQIVPGQEARAANPAAAGNIYVNLKSFATRGEAQRYLEQTTRHLRSNNNTRQRAIMVQRGNQYVVRMGPFQKRDNAETLKRNVLTAL